MTDLATSPSQRARELEESVERLSQAMLNNYEITEEPYAGGLMASQTIVRVSYNDLRIALAACDKALSSPLQPSQDVERVVRLVDELSSSIEMLDRHGPDLTCHDGEFVNRSVLDDRRELIDDARIALASLTPPVASEELVERLKEAFKPFERMADALESHPDNRIITNDRLARSGKWPNYYLTMRDIRKASAAIAALASSRVLGDQNG